MTKIFKLIKKTLANIVKSRIARSAIPIALIWCIAFLWYIDHVKSFNSEKPIKSDGIVVLTGGSERLKYGIDMLINGQGKRLLISGVGTGVSLEDLKASMEDGYQQKIDQVKELIDLDHMALNTAGNAEETKKWMNKNNFGTLTIVTSNYHIPRSLLLFKEQMPEVSFNYFAVNSENIALDDWVEHPNSQLLLFTEFNKFLISKIRLTIESSL